jgi:hypothetical protein
MSSSSHTSTSQSINQITQLYSSSFDHSRGSNLSEARDSTINPDSAIQNKVHNRPFVFMVEIHFHYHTINMQKQFGIVLRLSMPYHKRLKVQQVDHRPY